VVWSPASVDHERPNDPEFVGGPKAESGTMNQVIEGKPGFVNANEGVEPDAAVPLMLTGKGAQANLQNETAPGPASARP
jgi:hypothetical protein